MYTHFRRAEPNRRWGLHNLQNWAYATKRRHCCMSHTVALCTRACLEIKRKTEKNFLLRVKTHIHLFTYSLFPPLVWKWNQRPKTFPCSELKHLFTYSPIHFLLSSSHSTILGGQNQNDAVAITSSRIGRMGLKDGWHHYCCILGMTHTTALCNRACLKIKWKMASFFFGWS